MFSLLKSENLAIIFMTAEQKIYHPSESIYVPLLFLRIVCVVH